MTNPTFKATEWRGPFVVKRSGRKWKIVNRHGEDERIGYSYHGAAIEEVRLMNLAQHYVGERDLTDVQTQLRLGKAGYKEKEEMKPLIIITMFCALSIGCGAQPHNLVSPLAPTIANTALSAGFQCYQVKKGDQLPFDVITDASWTFAHSTAGCAPTGDNLLTNSSHVAHTATQTIVTADLSCGRQQFDGLRNGVQVLGVVLDYGVDCAPPSQPEPGGTCTDGFVMTGEGCKVIQDTTPPAVTLRPVAPVIDVCPNVEGSQLTIPNGFVLLPSGLCYPFKPGPTYSCEFVAVNHYECHLAQGAE